MKESITKFDLEAAFKALDDIETPIAEKGVKANKPALTEIFSRKSKFDALFEEYYDIGSSEELSDAKEAREAEVAKAKLARIEKIVDLDAESPEDLLTSYVGKFIIQCPQCMTLFYKNPEDVVESEEDSTTVNIEEVCQHCGNDSGYTLIGKVGEAEAEDTAEIPTEESTEGEDLDLELPTEEEPEETSEEGAEDDLDFDLEAIDIEEPEEDEKKEESFMTHEGEALVEEIQDDKDLDAKLEAHNEYIEYLRAAISQEEEALEKTSNEQVKAAIQRRIDAFKADLENALPDEVKNELAVSEEATEEPAETEEVAESLTEALHEEADLEVSAEEFEELIDSPEFKKPISDSDARAMMQEINDQEVEEEFQPEKNTDSQETTTEEAATEGSSLEEGIFDKLKDKFTDAIDNIASKLKSREAKADWVRENAMEDYNNVKADAKGQLVPDEKNQRFHTFVVIGYTDKYSNGKTITMAPSFNNKDLVVGKNGAQEKKNYKDADNIAKGWSMTQGNGPAFIYLAKNKDDDKAVFLCEYFKGELENDQLEKYFNVVKDHLKGAKLMAKGGMNSANEEPEAEETNASAEGNVEVNTEPTATAESLNTIMNGLEELHESSLEKLISNSLVETYGNVAGFRLSNCGYLNEQFTVNGTIYFTSGNTRTTTYTFTEAYVKEDKINLFGLNEKLGLDKQFIISGSAENRTFITESFNYTSIK